MTEPLPKATRLGIGKVLDELRPEFPTLTISKIRYLEEQELIEPERTASGYRKFSFEDVERLRFILRQQKKFWPLSNIRQLLDDMDRGLVPQTELGTATRVPEVGMADDGLPPPETFLEGRSQLRLSREEVLESSGISGELLQQVEEHGLIRRRPSQRYYDGDDLVIAGVAKDFAALGLEPRHLRHFATSADRQASLFEQVTGPRGREDEPTSTLAQLAALSVRLHTVLVRERLRG
ncbi:MerR family transcriptional regulator [Aeromicrobium sp. CF4.19]|uniref:transcriptional regulator FtsR n=1 Tax=Aeromicrobium sp. CF4.19 TaxID=3373082 RepID=UPI003EE813E1